RYGVQRTIDSFPTRRSSDLDEWAFKNYVESDAYEGPDMTDFGRRALVDEAFKVQYDEEMTKFQNEILTNDDFSEEFGHLGDVYGDRKSTRLNSSHVSISYAV